MTFHEHTAGVTAVSFTSNGQVILSSSLDGTVRAFDLNRFVSWNNLVYSQKRIHYLSYQILCEVSRTCLAG